jgi:hypothetical protein
MRTFFARPISNSKRILVNGTRNVLEAALELDEAEQEEIVEALAANLYGSSRPPSAILSFTARDVLSWAASRTPSSTWRVRLVS